MESERDEAFRRRRIQNRMAQRRFRQKQSLQKAAENGQNNPYPSPDLYHQDLPPGNSLSPEFLNLPGTNVDSAWIFDGLDLEGGNGLLLDGNGFMEMDNVSTQDLDSSYSSALQTPTASFKDREHTLSSISQRSNDSSERHFTVSSEGERLRSHTPDALNSPSSSSQKGNGWLSTLHIAAQKGHDRIVRVLMEHKIDCNERDSDGLTPLMHAAIGGYEEVASSLLSHGARIGDVDSQCCRSALHWAVLHRREALLNVLLNRCAGERSFINGYDNTGRTPLHTAVDTGFEAGVHILLQFGASPHCKARRT